MKRVFVLALVLSLLESCDPRGNESNKHRGNGPDPGGGSGGIGGQSSGGSHERGGTSGGGGSVSRGGTVGRGGVGGQSGVGAGESGGMGGQSDEVEVTSVEPREGEPGEEVTIRGFGLSGAVVLFDTTTAVRVSDDDRVIVRSVPALAPGTVSLSVANLAAGDFEVLPRRDVTDVEPQSGVSGDEVTIRGVRLAGAEVRFGSTVAEVLSDSANEIVCRVPEVTPAMVPLSVGSTDAGSFLVLGAVVQRITPRSGVIGSEVTISGRGLEGDEVLVGDAPAEVVMGTDTELAVRIPDHAVGFARIAVAGVSAGDFEVLGPRITRVCPSRNPVGAPLQIRGEGLDALSSLQIGSITLTQNDYELRSDGSIVLEIPELPLGSLAIVATGARGAPPPATFELLEDFPADLPASPSSIIGSRRPSVDYVPPVGRIWSNYEDGDHWLRLGGDDPCAAMFNSGRVVGSEELLGAEYEVTGTYDKATNSISLEIDRDGVVETYRGEWLDNGYTGIANYHQLLLTSDSDCRQTLMEVDTTGLCVQQ